MFSSILNSTFVLIGVPIIIFFFSIRSIINGLSKERKQFPISGILKKCLIIAITQLSVLVVSFVIEKLFFTETVLELVRLSGHTIYLYICVFGGIRLIIWLVVMKKWVQEYVYWVLSVFVILFPRSAIYYWYIRGDTIGDLVAPIFLFFINIVSLFIIWSCIKFYNWESQGKQKEKQPLKKTVIKYIKVLCFQLLLSVVLEVILISNNMFLSFLAIVFFLGAIFIFRKKISVSYIFWIISWLFIDSTAIFLGGKSISSFHMLVRQQLETNCMIGFSIYHILLTVYFKLKEDKK